MKSFKSFTAFEPVMSHPPQYFKTQQLADALGVGVSTLKRWVDSGQLRASRTVGKHRLISLEEAFRFARSNSLATTGLELLSDPERPAPVAIDGGIRGELITALKEGRSRDAKRLIASAHRASGSGAALADELIAPVLERVGHGWSIGTWDVFEEHQASQIVAAAILEEIARVPRGGDSPAPIAIGAAPEGDLYTLALLLGELTLRELGWDVKNLGPNLPLRSLARAITAQRPKLVYLTVSHLADPIHFLKDYSVVSEAARAEGSTIVVGGRGIPPELIDRLDNASHGSRMAHLHEVGRELLLKFNGGVSDLPPALYGLNN
jgi:excisionase family DNA binding protein